MLSNFSLNACQSRGGLQHSLEGLCLSSSDIAAHFLAACSTFNAVRCKDSRICLAAGLAFISLRRARLLRQTDADSESSGGVSVTGPPKLQPEQEAPARLKHGIDVFSPSPTASTSSTASHSAHDVRPISAAESCLTPCPPAMLQAAQQQRDLEFIEERPEGRQPLVHPRLSSRGFPGGWVMKEDVKAGQQDPSMEGPCAKESRKSAYQTPAL